MRRILSYIRPYLRRMGIGLLIKFTGTIMDLALPWCLAYMIDDVVPLKDREQIYLWGGMMLAFSAIAVINNIAANRMASRVARDATRNIRHDLYSRISMLSCRQYDDVTIPSLISRLTSDTYNMNRMLGMMQRIGVRAPILLLGGVTVTLILDARLSLVLLCTLPLIGLGIVLISRKGIRVIKALSKTEHERSRFESVNNEVVKAEKKAGMVMAATNPLMNMLLNVGLTFVIVTGAFLVQDGISEPGKIIAFLTYFTIILNAMLSINRIFVMYSQASASAKRIAEVLDTPFDMPLREADSITTQDHIRFENVSFSYNNVQDSLTDIDFTLGHGETLGVMGATGSGKTTLILLLQRFYEASKGTVRIDGRNVNCIPGDELHTMFGIAFQSDTLFADTIRENIDFGRGLPMERIELAARCAQAYEFISSLPDGYNHMLTSKATNLSGGQKQRLLIARALAGSPKILILDDSSSALDYRTDAAMRQAVRESFPDTTTILIAQRVSSVRHADKIIMLDEGRIVGIGSHEQLMHTCPVYRETARTQMGVE